MPQPVNDIGLHALNVQNGAEPVLIIRIGFGYFASKDIFGIPGRIISATNCTNSRKSDHKGSTGAMTVTLDDSDGYFKGVIDTTMLEKTLAEAFIVFEGTTQADGYPILVGQIAAPVEYNEGERTLSITIETTIEAREIGFAPTDEFTDLSPEAIGIPWPMVFGHCAHVPCPKVRQRTEGFLKVPIRLTSNIYKTNASDGSITLDDVCHVQSYLNGVTPATDEIYVAGGNQFPQDTLIKIVIEGVVFEGRMLEEIFFVNRSNIPAYENIKFDTRTQAGVPLDITGDPTYAWLKTTKQTNKDGSVTQIALTGMYIYIKPPPGSPAGIIMTTKVAKQELKKLQLREPVIEYIHNKQYRMNETDQIDSAYAIMKNGLVGQAAHMLENLMTSVNWGLKERLGATLQTRLGLIKKTLDRIKGSTEHFWQVPAETSVRIWEEADPDVYIISCVQMATIDAVYGHKRELFPDGTEHKVLAPIPDDHYELQLQSNYKVNGAFVSGLIFYKPLKDISDEGWDGRVFATGTSTVGPDIGDIIGYNLKTYAPQVTFSKGNFVSPHPANFVYHTRKNAIDFCCDLAWQAKSALQLNSFDVVLVYLAHAPIVAAVVNQSNTEKDSLRLGFTPTSEIKTKLVARWALTNKDKPEPATYNELKAQSLTALITSIVENDSPKKMDDRVNTYRENIDIFGLKEEEVSIFIYNNESAVKDVLAFWGHRYANTWRKVSLRTFMNGSFLTAFDGIGLAYAWPSNLNVIGVIESVSINFSEKTVMIDVWLPILAGHAFVDSLAFPG